MLLLLLLLLPVNTTHLMFHKRRTFASTPSALLHKQDQSVGVAPCHCQSSAQLSDSVRTVACYWPTLSHSAFSKKNIYIYIYFCEFFYKNYTQYKSVRQFVAAAILIPYLSKKTASTYKTWRSICLAEETDWDVRQTRDTWHMTRDNVMQHTWQTCWKIKRPKLGKSGGPVTLLSVGLSARGSISGTAKQNMQAVSERPTRNKAATALSKHPSSEWMQAQPAERWSTFRCFTVQRETIRSSVC